MGFGKTTFIIFNLSGSRLPFKKKECGLTAAVFFHRYASIREKEMKDQEAALARSRIPKTTEQQQQQQQEGEKKEEKAPTFNTLNGQSYDEYMANYYNNLFKMQQKDKEQREKVKYFFGKI